MSNPPPNNPPATGARARRGDGARAFDAVLSLPHACVGVLTRDVEVYRLVPLPPDTPLQLPGTAAAVEVALQVAAYLRDPAHAFTLRMPMAGTVFQRRVWDALSATRPGEVVTYSDLADALESGPRAVANACRDNPCPLVVPCHRVVGKKSLGGYAGHVDGWAVDFKRWLIEHERGA